MPRKLLKSKALLKGETVGLIGLASPVRPDLFQSGCSYIEKAGLKAAVPVDPSKFYGDYTYLFSANSVEERLRALYSLYQDKNVSAVLSVRGGYGSMELLPHLKFDLLRSNAKVTVGFSDATAFLIALYQAAGLAVIHGPSLVTLGPRCEKSSDAATSISKLLELLRGEIANPFEGMVFEEVAGCSKPGIGRLIGGNLSILAALSGTPWQPMCRNHILFFEETGEEPYRIHRMLTQMKLAGVFEGLKGVLVGQCNGYESNEDFKPKVRDVVRDVFNEYSVPVLQGLPFGHGDLNFPIPIGIEARIFENKLELLEKSVL
ncbi:MAG: LD-carboxypeptidase [Deltaproteobacteria bacterium]|nr:LD-carboxypeptidase [Deltaproteobacteria bacterium]